MPESDSRLHLAMPTVPRSNPSPRVTEAGSPVRPRPHPCHRTSLSREKRQPTRPTKKSWAPRRLQWVLAMPLQIGRSPLRFRCPPYCTRDLHKTYPVAACRIRGFRRWTIWTSLAFSYAVILHSASDSGDDRILTSRRSGGIIGNCPVPLRL